MLMFGPLNSDLTGLSFDKAKGFRKVEAKLHNTGQPAVGKPKRVSTRPDCAATDLPTFQEKDEITDH